MCSLQRAQGLGVRPTRVLGYEGVDDVLAEGVLEVHHVVANAELAGDAAGVVDILDAAALLVAAKLVGALLGPEAHGDADDVVALLDEEGGGDGAIDTAGHGADDAGSIHGCATILTSAAGGMERALWNPSPSPTGSSIFSLNSRLRTLRFSTSARRPASPTTSYWRLRTPHYSSAPSWTASGTSSRRRACRRATRRAARRAAGCSSTSAT